MNSRLDMALHMALMEFQERRDVSDRVHFTIDHGNDMYIIVSTLPGSEYYDVIDDRHEYLGSVGMNCGLMAFCDAVIRLLKAS